MGLAHRLLKIVPKISKISAPARRTELSFFISCDNAEHFLKPPIRKATE